MYLSQPKLQHLNSITHEGKVVVFATDADGKISYTVKQDGFEDSYLNTPADQRTGWESWKSLEFPNEADDQSVINQETAKLTYQKDNSQFVLRSRYKTETETAVAPVQAISALGHVYIFRQSKSNTLLVDRFVLDGMTNKLNRKLEVRFKRSKQKHTPITNMNKESNGLVNIDSLDFRDANGNFFYEPTTELCLINNLYKGWFSIVLVPTIENDVYRWHIFAYNSQTQKVELTTIRASEEGLFDVQDYTIFQEENETLVPRRIPGIIKRTLDIKGVAVTNGLSATKYDLQQAQKTQSGEEQLLKTATKLMLAVPTDQGTAAFSFAIAGDGTLGEIDDTPDSTIIRSHQREVLLPLNTLDEIKAIGDRTPPPQGIITGFAEGTDEEEIEDLVKISTDGKAAELANGDLVKITGTRDYQGLYRTQKVDDHTFDIDLPSGNGLGYWEKEDLEEGGLIFDGMITAYQKTTDGKLRVTCENHGLENGDEVQITGTEDYNNTYPVQKIDDTHFVIERKWTTGAAINVKLVSRKRRGIVFDGVSSYVEIPYSVALNPSQFTVTCWAKVTGGQGTYRSVVSSRDISTGNSCGYIIYAGTDNKWQFWLGDHTKDWIKVIGSDIVLNQWTHIAATFDGSQAKLYINGVLAAEVAGNYTVNTTRPLRISTGATEGKQQFFFSGQIADVLIWNLVRTELDIKNNMYLQLTGKELGLVGYWRLGAISEGKVVDFSVNGQDGTVYGDAYVSAATLDRKLAGGGDAVKYSNPELFAVSERTTYEESFEFKVVSSSAVNLAYLDNADGKNLGTKIFTLSYWGKASRSAEEKQVIAPEQIKQNKFEDLGGGWYRVSGNVTIPDGISMLRCFEIAKIQGDWQSLEIRKHRIRLLSDSITEAKYTDTVSLTTLADSQKTLADKLKELELKEQQERVLLKEKRDLDLKIAAYNAQDATREKIKQLEGKITSLTSEEQTLKSAYQNQVDSPFNYFCSIKAAGETSNYNGKNIYIYAERNSDRLCGYTVPDQWEFISQGGNVYTIKAAGDTYNCYGKDIYVHAGRSTDVLYAFSVQDKWEFISQGGDVYKIKAAGETSNCYGKDIYIHAGRSNDRLYGFSVQDQWQLIKGSVSNTSVIERAKRDWDAKAKQLSQAKEELALLKAGLSATAADKLAWDTRLAQVGKEITALQTELNTLNTNFLNSVKHTEQTPQAMLPIAKDSRGLVTQGAILGFVNSVTRLNAMETSEGNVQLSYFDNQGRMRQTNYDATADSKNTSVEQWIPDAQRACLNFNNSKSVVKLDKPLYLPPNWTIEAWFVYPFPEVGEWNILTNGEKENHHILVRNRKQLGIFLHNDPLGQKFYDSGFDMDSLSPGWHHLSAVGKDNTTLFYIDGKAVGDTRTKALADAQASLAKAPNDATLKQKLEDINKASLKVSTDVYTIGNYPNGEPIFGKVAEVRIWGVALSNEEIAVNSKTLLSGNEPGLLAYYPFNEATGEVIRDQSGQGKNGKVSGAMWWGCTAPIGNPGNTVMQFDGVNDYVAIPYAQSLNPSDQFTVSCWVKVKGGQQLYRSPLTSRGTSPASGYMFYATEKGKWDFWVGNGTDWSSVTGPDVVLNTWTHIAGTYDGKTLRLYVDGVLSGTLTCTYTPNQSSPLRIGAGATEASSPNFLFPGQVADVRIWNKARTQAEIQGDMYQRLSGKEANLVAYYPLNQTQSEGSVQKVLDLAGNNYGTVNEAMLVENNNLPIAPNALLCNEYSNVSFDSNTKRKVAMMRRFFAYPSTNGVTLLPDKRVEALQLKWIGNAQFAPTLLGYIEGPPPVPTENLTLEDDYNGATSVELTMSEDVEFNWTRSQDSGLGGTLETFVGTEGEISGGTDNISYVLAAWHSGYKSNFDFSYQFQNESSITSSSSLSMTDKLELRGTPEVTPKFPHLGTRFIPKNIGYALVVSAIADVFVTRLARSGKMVGYEVLPVDGIPPDVNTITFLMNPAYTMNGSLDGLTGSSATSDRFFKHVPEMRSQYGSLYPASYYRLQEAYDLKRQIEAEDKRRESYFSNFDVRLVDETSLDRNIDSGPAPSTIGVQREEDKPSSTMTEEEKKKAEEAKLQKQKDEAAAKTKEQQIATQQKQAEIQSKIGDQEKRVQATESFAGWQKRMESIQIRSGKRNIVNTYVWDADGGLRTEAQSFANTVEHTIGGSFIMNAGSGVEGKFVASFHDAELSAQATVNLTQTMSKTELRSKGFELNVDLSGLESKGITDYKDRPILPGEKVDRYRFMSFYLEGSTQNFQDFFNYVVDPEWLQSNDEEARALRQAQAGKPNKAWRVLHRVTYVERPALMGFGQDVRKLREASATSSNQQLLDKIAKLEDANRKLEEKLDKILNYLQQPK
ncbi:LamG domain-containing protein [Planktothrix sp. FACHB-1365]|uniref:LamG domain-containing protein n=1 Tax=Planktothrix sp. FACHB-1365 TaxID=2692855 RepID=UPI001683C8AF|nr:LamG domain-containing protein [Planktothrix sp. FACHB-1365]MBD2483494.1 LamG domain-containing protein [Planktothrix sp. FACHB-1365]